MSKEPESFIEVVGLWSSRFDMASDIRANPEAVRKWCERNSIPAEWWAAILATPIAQSAGLKPEHFVALAAREPVEARA